jgi:hypothetical protein
MKKKVPTKKELNKKNNVKVSHCSISNILIFLVINGVVLIHIHQIFILVPQSTHLKSKT